MQNKTQVVVSFFFQLSLLLISFYSCFYLLNIYPTNYFSINNSLSILLIAWLITGWITHKYKPHYYQRTWIYVIAPFFKGVVVYLVIIFILNFLFHVTDFQTALLYKAAFLYLLCELIIYSIIIFYNQLRRRSTPLKPIEPQKFTQEDLLYEKDYKYKIDLEGSNIKFDLFSNNIIYELFEGENNKNLPNNSKVEVINSQKNNVAANKSNLITILDVRINDLKEINIEFKQIYNSIKPGGYLIAAYKNIDEFEEDYFGSNKGFTKFFKKTYYYIYYRAFPKIPYLNVLYKILSRGENKVLSKAEAWGRLFYAGFDVEKEIKHNGICYLIARKVKTPSENPNPSFYPIITLNRVSISGNLVKIHKVRSMYPYSEFLQKKVFEQNELTSTGKFAADFRITEFGKIYRKYWIDEIPQLLDWFRGTIKLVGIRAMSQHFFSLYPQEYQEMYFKVKPGIISPIFDEKTDGFKDIVRIEQAYLESFLKNPVKTDIKYFYITISRMFGGVRSK